GKTSLGASIAEALGRKYQRVSLGGLHDEAEIRGHRRTYVGAMPGRIIDAVRRAGSSNPVLLLDEVDKIGSDFKGDPSAALLEVLDPEQNCRFHDNYIDVDFDLSDVLFIATANTLQTLSQPLLDRMEVIDIAGYSAEEKMEIARRHLIPRQLKANLLSDSGLRFSDEALRKLIDGYTAESGVRQLEKAVTSVVRKIVLRKMRGAAYPVELSDADIRDLLGLETRHPDAYEGNDIPGVVTGLAWTAVGGEILFVESSTAKAKGGDRLALTGNLGDVMKESVEAARTVLRSRATQLGISYKQVSETDIHVHFPEGAVPKDGPSAGSAITLGLVSAMTGIPVRADVAMTGEITLRGDVLPIGGLKEKLLAALRG
ncbi:MAG: AAA family ATPase, partial [Muribaculaceae bacterium]|nr:AAA family ATPase [Muribaculaceae bacterium]